MHSVFSKGPLFAVAALGVLVSGCASQEDVEKAQTTADQAMSAAQAAQRSADQNRGDINALGQKVDTLGTRMDHLESMHRGGERG